MKYKSIQILKLTKLRKGPDFIIIGAERSGTTSLYNYLIEFGANFIPAKKKEIDFFSTHYGKGCIKSIVH